MSRATDQFKLLRNAEGGICVHFGGDRMFVYPNDRYLSARLLFAMADALLCDAKAAPEPATVAGDNGTAIDVIISPKGGVSADFSSDKTRRAFAEQISKFKDFGSKPATVAVDAGALDELRKTIVALDGQSINKLLSRSLRMGRVVAAARSLLAGGGQ